MAEKLTCLATPVKRTYLRCLECIKTPSVDNEAGEWDATVSLSETYRYNYQYKSIGRSRSNLQCSRGTWLHMSSRAVQMWLGEKLRQIVSGLDGLSLGHRTRADKHLSMLQ